MTLEFGKERLLMAQCVLTTNLSFVPHSHFRNDELTTRTHVIYNVVALCKFEEQIRPAI